MPDVQPLQNQNHFNEDKQGEDCTLNCLHFVTQIIRTYSTESQHRKLINFILALFSGGPKTKSGNLKFSE